MSRTTSSSQVTKGLTDGDVVVLNPISLMSEDEKREAFRSAKDDQERLGQSEGEPGKGGRSGEPPARASPARAATPRPRPRRADGGGGNPFMQKMRSPRGACS